MRGLCIAAMLLGSSMAGATGWCDLQPGWDIYTSGNNSNQVWIYGVFVGQSTYRWIRINDTATGYGQTNIAMALSALMSSRGISVYLDEVEDTCANFPNNSGAIRHMRVLP